MDFDQALRIACFYGMILEVESLLWMEADASAVLFNHRDRGTAFHPTVNPAVRDGINELLSDGDNGVDDDDNGADGSSNRRSTGGGGAAAAAALRAAREAAAAWGAGEPGCASPSKTMASSASTSTGWTSGAESSCCRDGGGDGHGGGYQSSSVASDIDSSVGGRNVRPSFGLGREDLPGESEEEDDIGTDEDDAFVLPSMLTLENDLIREGSFYASAGGKGGGCIGGGRNSTDGAAAADASLASTGAVAAMRRFGQRVKEGVVGPAAAAAGTGVSDGDDGNGGGDSGGGSSSVSPSHGGGGSLKDKARAKLAGVVKWAQSPRRALSPGGRSGVRAFAG